MRNTRLVISGLALLGAVGVLAAVPKPAPPPRSLPPPKTAAPPLEGRVKTLPQSPLSAPPSFGGKGAGGLGPGSSPAHTAVKVQTARQVVPDAFYGGPSFPERYRPYATLLAKDESEREQGLRFNKIIRGDVHRPRIALTFDDGPHPVYTLALLNVLRRTHTPATFFVVGKQVEKNPALVQLEVAEGHEVGNHTYDHVNMTLLPPELIPFELDACDAAIKKATGASVRFFRPPGGDYNGDVIRDVSRRGYITTLWTDDPGDFQHPPAAVVLRRALGHLENGSIILLHDGIPQTIEVLPALINEARRRGYQFVTLGQLARGD